MLPVLTEALTGSRPELEGRREIVCEFFNVWWDGSGHSRCTNHERLGAHPFSACCAPLTSPQHTPAKQHTVGRKKRDNFLGNEKRDEWHNIITQTLSLPKHSRASHGSIRWWKFRIIEKTREILNGSISHLLIKFVLSRISTPSTPIAFYLIMLLKCIAIVIRTIQGLFTDSLHREHKMKSVWWCDVNPKIAFLCKMQLIWVLIKKAIGFSQQCTICNNVLSGIQGTHKCIFRLPSPTLIF